MLTQISLLEQFDMGLPQGVPTVCHSVYIVTMGSFFVMFTSDHKNVFVA